MKKKQVVLVLLAVTAVISFAACDNPWWPHKDMGTLTYDANGGVGTVPAAQTADFRTPIIIASQSGLTKPDHNFYGWNTKRTGDGVNYDTGATLTLSGDITLYANWVQIDPENPENGNPGNYYPGGGGGGGYYYPGGGGGNSGPPYSITYIGGPTINNIYPNVLHTVEEAPVMGVGDDKEFLGWRAQDGVLHKEKSEIRVTANMTFTPVWATKAKGLFVITKNTSLTASGAAFYASYDPNHPEVREDITIQASEDDVGPFYISDIRRSYEISDAAFDLVYADDDENDSPTYVVLNPSVRSRATVTLGQPVAPKLDTGQKVTFRIRPRNKFIPVGTHSLEVSIDDRRGHGATFAMSFVVYPIELTIKTGGVTYTNSGGALTPIQAPSYTERTASFSVMVSGFAQADDAKNISLSHLEFDGGVIATVNGLDISHNVGTTDAGIVNGDGVTIFTKTWTVTVALNDTKAFISGEALAYIGLGGFKQNTENYQNNYYYEGNYYYEYKNESPGAKITLNVHDGHAPTTAQAIPVRQQNVAAFNYYAGTANGLKRHYKQTEDITLSAPAAGESNWTTIGDFYNDKAFTGSYNGDGKKITDLTMDLSGEVDEGVDKNHQGMFSLIGNSGVVKNLKLVDVDITCETYVGGLVYFSKGTVSNCSITGSVFTSYGYSVGGVVGWNDGGTVEYCVSSAKVTSDMSSGMYLGGVVGLNSGTVQNCSATGNVSGISHVGGVVGNNDGTVENCYATGNVNGYENVGGVVGNNSYGSKVEYCYYTTGNVTGIGSVGGVVGNNMYGEVRYCYVTGATITGAGSTAGGVIGGNSSGTVEQCYVANTNVTVMTANSYTNQGRYAGGVVGWNSGEVRNCYITGGTVTGGTYTGGVVGRNNNGGNTQYCYSTCVVIGSGVYSTAADFLGGVVGANHNSSIAQNNVALNPSVTGSGLKYVGRVVGKNSTYNNLERGTTPTKNYAWSGMTTTNDDTAKASDVIDGDPITATEWHSLSWWTTPGNWTGNAWNTDIWNIADGSLPTLKNMPDSPAQNPVAP